MESKSTGLRTWQEVFEAYRDYGTCVNYGGAIAEGWAASVARLAADDWSRFDELNRLVSTDPAFQEFVLTYLDELMTREEAVKIRKNAERHCPAGGKRFCKLISRKIREIEPRTEPAWTPDAGTR